LGVGALVGILYAPKSGRETREDIAAGAREGTEYLRTKGKQAAEQVGAIVDQSKEQFSDLMDKGKEQVTEYVGRSREAVDRGRAQWEEFVERGKSLVTDQTPECPRQWMRDARLIGRPPTRQETRFPSLGHFASFRWFKHIPGLGE
jgi:gas vesicle protein